MQQQDGAPGGPDASEGGADGSGHACSTIGAACTGNAACCSAYCKASVCACNSDGYGCKTNADCCASDCVQGTCGGKKDGSSTALPPGSLEPAYGSGGCTTLAYANDDKNDSKPLAAGLDASGKLFVVGQTETDGIGGSSASASGWLATLDGSGHIASNVALPTTFGPVYGLALSSAGATLFGDGEVERTDASGNVDPSFSWGLDAGVGAPSGEYQSSGALVILDGSNLVRLTSSGAIDATFGTGGSVAVTAMTPDSLVLDGSDRIYVAGSSGSEWMLARYTSGGALDPTFGSQGVADAGPAPRDTLTGGRNFVRASKSGSDVYVIGRDDDPNANYTQLWIVHAGAAGVDGHAGLPGPTVETTPDFVFADAAVQDDGKLVVAGTDAGGLYWYLTRVSGPATVDPSYGTAGWVATRADTPSGGAGTTIYGPRFVTIASDGGAIVVEERQYVQNLYAEDNAIVCKFAP